MSIFIGIRHGTQETFCYTYWLIEEIMKKISTHFNYGNMNFTIKNQVLHKTNLYAYIITESFKANIKTVTDGFVWDIMKIRKYIIDNKEESSCLYIFNFKLLILLLLNFDQVELSNL